MLVFISYSITVEFVSSSIYRTIICGTLKIDYAMSLIHVSLKLQAYERRKGVDL